MNVCRLFFIALAAPSLALAGPLTPSEAIKSFELSDDRLAIEVAASEPQIEDPVAVAWDEDGRMLVVEMRGFQQGPDAKGLPGLGRITRFEDRDGDGRYDHSTIYADSLYYATTVAPAYGGILVGCAPDILFFKDTDGDGKADVRKVVYSGLGRGNHEQLLNFFQWSLDNWFHAASGGSGGNIRPVDSPDANALEIGTRNVRFRIKPNGDPAGFETISGGGQFGLASDDWGHEFTSQNSRHLIQIVLGEEYARRNPYLAVPRVSVDIPDHAAACKVYRRSPLEEWRVVRTRQRAADPKYASRLPASELVPGGYITSGCGNSIYRADLLPSDYIGQSFTCEPANNLIHRDRLTGDGPQFTAVRVEPDRDFLASTDNWFRPVTTATGPDGCLYVVDMYREVIETPVSIPPEILKTINMDNGKDMGRIYRIRPKNSPPRTVPHLGKASLDELVEHLADSNAWCRLTAQRLLVERQDRNAIPKLAAMISEGNSMGRMHALCALANLGEIAPQLLVKGLTDKEPGVRRVSLRLAEPSLARDVCHHADPVRQMSMVRTLTQLAEDPSPDVRFQLALTLGAAGHMDSSGPLKKLAERDMENPWIRTAILLSLGNRAADFWTGFWKGSTALQNESPAAVQFVHDLSAVVGARQKAPEWAALLRSALETKGRAWMARAVLEGLHVGMERAGGRVKLTGNDTDVLTVRGALMELAGSAGPARRAAWNLGGHMSWPESPSYAAALDSALALAANTDAALQDRQAALAFAAGGPPDRTTFKLLELLTPEQPVEIQKAIVSALTGADRKDIATQLLDRDRWFSYTPAVRDGLVTSLLSRNEFVPALLAAIKEGHVPAWIIDSNQRQRLLTSSNPDIRSAAKAVLVPVSNGEREQVYDRYLPALAATADLTRGREVFRANCSTCHRLEGVGSSVGPDLNGVRDRPGDQLLGDILIPSKAVTAGYSAYMIETQDGESITGVIAGESATALTLRQKEGVERTLLRTQIKSVMASTLSMMPEGLEQTISPQQMADLIAYVKAAK